MAREVKAPVDKNIFVTSFLTRFGSRPELPFVGLLFLIYLVFQIHAAVYHGYWAQDFTTHKTWITLAAHDPWDYIKTYREGRTNPPLYHVLAGLMRRAAGLPSTHYLLGIGLMNVTFSVFGLAALYALACRLIVSPYLRLAAMMFAMFVPFAMIHAEVVASDAIATPLFLVFVWTIVRLPERKSSRAFANSIAVSSLLLVIGMFTKFTFGSLIAASAVCLALLWWTRVLSTRRFAAAFVLVTVMSAALGYAEMRRFTSQQKYNLGIVSLPSLSAVLHAPMNPRSILFFRAADTDVLKAPSYDWMKTDSFLLLVSNKHSYPALLHLAIFTDILNVYQDDPYDTLFGRRTVSHLHRMQLAVWLGILFSLMALIGAVTVLVRSAVSAVIRRSAADIPVLILLVCCLAWFFNIVVLLPFAPDSYNGGYWLPRLIAPALLGFFLTGFVFLDRLKWNTRRFQIAVLAVVFVQSSLHASFLWPSASYGPFYEPNEDVAHTRWPVKLRVFGWQGAMGEAMGFVIDRRSNKPEIDHGLLSFNAAPGPANPAKQRRIRLSCKYCKTQIFDFGGPTKITFDVPIAQGRNEVLAETLEPEQVVEKPGDPTVPLVLISDVKFDHPGVSQFPDAPITSRGVIMSVTPRNSTSRNQTFTVVIDDDHGYEDVDYLYFMVDDVPAIPRFTCHGYYQGRTNALLLYEDTTRLTSQKAEVGAGPLLNNGRCTVDPVATTVKGSGTQLTVSFAMSLDPSYNNKKVYFWVKDHDNGNTGWVDTGTTWNVPAGTRAAPVKAAAPH